MGRAGNGKIISMRGQLPFTSELLTPGLWVRVPPVLQKQLRKVKQKLLLSFRLRFTSVITFLFLLYNAMEKITDLLKVALRQNALYMVLGLLKSFCTLSMVLPMSIVSQLSR